MKKPSVLLVKSRSRVSKLPYAVPPLGVLYLAAALRSRLGAEVRIIDAIFEADPEEAVRRAVRELAPDVLGISALTPESPLAHRIAEAARGENAALAIVMGGPHPSADHCAVLSDHNVDAAAIGEGEETITELVRLIVTEGPRWKDPASLRGVPGLAFRGEAGVELSVPRPPIHDLDSLPFPAWDLIDFRRFWKLCGMASMGPKPYLPMLASRGCPYHCVFCHQIFGKVFRGRSPESVVEEAALIRRLGAGHLEFYDDTPNLEAPRFDRMLEVLAARGPALALSFPNGLRADLLSEASYGLLKRAGAREVSVGVETASPRLQKLMNKHLSLEKTARAIGKLAALRIFTRGFFMLGLPTETEAEMLETIRFAHSSRLHMAIFFMPAPYRNTDIYDMFVKAGKLPARFEAADMEYHASPFNASDIPDPRFRRLYRWAFFVFFLSPARIFRIFRDGTYGRDTPLRVWHLLRNSISFRRPGRD